MKLSPMTNQRGTNGGAVKSGFDREQFFRANEYSFDAQFGYSRSVQEGYDYCNALKNGSHRQYEQSLYLDTGISRAPALANEPSIDRSAGLDAGL
jgi:hypothetical protein